MTLRYIKLKTASKRSANIVPTKIHPKVNLLIDNQQRSLATMDRIGEEIKIVDRILDLVYVATVQDQETGLGRQDNGHEVRDGITIGKGERF